LKVLNISLIIDYRLKSASNIIYKYRFRL